MNKSAAPLEAKGHQLMLYWKDRLDPFKDPQDFGLVSSLMLGDIRAGCIAYYGREKHLRCFVFTMFLPSRSGTALGESKETFKTIEDAKSFGITMAANWLVAASVWLHETKVANVGRSVEWLSKHEGWSSVQQTAPKTSGFNRYAEATQKVIEADMNNEPIVPIVRALDEGGPWRDANEA